MEDRMEIGLIKEGINGWRRASGEIPDNNQSGDKDDKETYCIDNERSDMDYFMESHNIKQYGNIEEFFELNRWYQNMIASEKKDD